MKKFLLIRSSNELDPSDEMLEQMAFEFMEAKKPSLTRRVLKYTTYTPYQFLIELGRNVYMATTKKDLRLHRAGIEVL